MGGMCETYNASIWQLCPMRPSLTTDDQHHLTIAEMISSTYALYVVDQLNQGADEAMTFDLVTNLRIMCWIRQTSIVGSILQPSSEVFQLFDHIIVWTKAKSCFKDPVRMHSPILSLRYMEKRRRRKWHMCTYIHTYIHRENLYVLFSGGVVTCYCFSE
jgi:hypothetical protein